MRHTLNMPKLGDSVDEVVILEWHVAPGDSVSVGDPLVSVETDKIDTDVPATVAGTVVELLVQPQDEVATGAPFIVVEA
jgi:pyruvate/2-oxoglutarate dehydrogenase complex dihydrolipoamide acyltransferase (E2) component